jgi:hypothetical protein
LSLVKLEVFRRLSTAAIKSSLDAGQSGCFEGPTRRNDPRWSFSLTQ